MAKKTETPRVAFARAFYYWLVDLGDQEGAAYPARGWMPALQRETGLPKYLLSRVMAGNQATVSVETLERIAAKRSLPLGDLVADIVGTGSRYAAREKKAA